LLDMESEAFVVAAYRQDWMPMLGGLPTEESLIEANCWSLNLLADLAPLPSVPLSLFDQLTRYPSTFVVCIDHVVQCGVCAWLGGDCRLERGGFGGLEGCIGFTELLLLKMRQRCKVEFQYLLRRYLPVGKIFPQPFNVESYVELFRNSSPCLKAGVSLR